jgi:hypothetical protein
LKIVKGVKARGGSSPSSSAGAFLKSLPNSRWMEIRKNIKKVDSEAVMIFSRLKHEKGFRVV